MIPREGESAIGCSFHNVLRLYSRMTVVVPDLQGTLDRPGSWEEREDERAREGKQGRASIRRNDGRGSSRGPRDPLERGSFGRLLCYQRNGTKNFAPVFLLVALLFWSNCSSTSATFSELAFALPSDILHDSLQGGKSAVRAPVLYIRTCALVQSARRFPFRSGIPQSSETGSSLSPMGDS